MKFACFLETFHAGKDSQATTMRMINKFEHRKGSIARRKVSSREKRGGRQNATNEKKGEKGWSSAARGGAGERVGENTVVGSSCFARNSPLVTRTETGGMKAGSKVLVRTEFPTLDAGYEA